MASGWVGGHLWDALSRFRVSFKITASAKKPCAVFPNRISRVSASSHSSRRQAKGVPACQSRRAAGCWPGPTPRARLMASDVALCYQGPPAADSEPTRFLPVYRVGTAGCIRVPRFLTAPSPWLQSSIIAHCSSLQSLKGCFLRQCAQWNSAFLVPLCNGVALFLSKTPAEMLRASFAKWLADLLPASRRFHEASFYRCLSESRTQILLRSDCSFWKSFLNFPAVVIPSVKTFIKQSFVVPGKLPTQSRKIQTWIR